MKSARIIFDGDAARDQRRAAELPAYVVERE
jgi:hypothetical protein